MKRRYLLVVWVWASIACSCQKYLDTKPSTDLVVPQTLDDFIRLMDNYEVMNSTPILGELSADNYYLATEVAWQALPTHQRDAYVFSESFEEGAGGLADWNIPYKQVFVANVVLEGLTKLPRTTHNADQWDFVKGWALFARSYAFFNLSQLFSPVYKETNATDETGIPLRILPGVDERYGRSTVAATYERIFADMDEAVKLLPGGVSAKNRNRSSKEAALGILARMKLAVGDYQSAKTNAALSLAGYDQLMSFEELSKQPLPFVVDINHPECIWQSRLGNSDGIFYRGISPNTLVDSSLYNSYQPGDLRKEFYFMPSSQFPGKANLNRSYGGGAAPVAGLYVDELYLIMAECSVREGDVTAGMERLNTLLTTRFMSDSFTPYPATDQVAALAVILDERRKETPFRGLRWMDLRRLNEEGANIAIHRSIGNAIYSLLPGSPRYVLPIPLEEIRLNNLTQNIR